MKKENLKIVGRNSILSMVLIAVLVIATVSCEKEESDFISDPENTEMNILEVLESYNVPEAEDETSLKRGFIKHPTYFTLSVALARTGLARTVATKQLTLFAPTDAAFAKLKLYPWNISKVPNLKQILLYHVVQGKVYSYQLSNGFVPTLNGAAVEINLENGVKVNDATVIKADLRARNGVIHVIDNVLFPPDKNLVELALSFDPEFSILVQAVIKAGLTDVLATGGPFTVFAPTNDAFSALLSELKVKSLDDITVDLLTKVLLYHVVEGRVFSSDLVSGSITTLNGDFKLDVGSLTITDADNRVAGLIPELLDVQATNGVIHVIDRVILPEL
jgi:transforming growth factor-beta-induced protein